MAWGDPVTPNLVEATWLGGHRIRLEFADGCAGVMDMKGRRWRGVFEPLKDVAQFRQFRLNREWNTITWPTGADLAPEYLYEQASSHPAPRTEEAPGRQEPPERADDATLAAAVGGSAPSEPEP